MLALITKSEFLRMFFKTGLNFGITSFAISNMSRFFRRLERKREREEHRLANERLRMNAMVSQLKQARADGGSAYEDVRFLCALCIVSVC